MWQPHPSWQRMRGGMGASTGGVWRAEVDGRSWVVKRLLAPALADPDELTDPGHFAFWRREAEVAGSGVVASTRGLRSPVAGPVEEDPDGITVWTAFVPGDDVPGPLAARAIGRFAREPFPDLPWLSRDLLASRIRRVEGRGGWPTLAGTVAADLVAELWERRSELLAAVGGLPQVPSHGDVVPGNLLGREGDEVVAVDWSALGRGPVGADLGYLSLSTREDFGVLLQAYLDGYADTGMQVDPAEVVLGARVMAAYMVVSRAEWALARVADAPGALESKYRHPSVAPYLRALQRAFPEIEPLLAG